MSSPSAAGPAGTASQLVDALEAARQRTLSLVAQFDDAELERVHSRLMSPLAWDLGHIAAFEDLWLVHRYGQRPLLHAELVEVYDAMETPRASRGELPFLGADEAREYLDRVRERTLAVIDERGVGDGILHELVLRHEQQHNETMLQAMQLARLDPGLSDGEAPPQPAPRATGLELIEIEGGEFPLGALGPGFAYDNERPRHSTDIRAFRIGRHPITNASYLHFVEGGGYERREWWSDEGWSWKEQYDITRPGAWTPDHTGEWRLGHIESLHPDRPVVHVSWFEADAFARAHDLRLPSEAEWEKAATWDQATGMARRYPWGNEAPLPGVHANVDLIEAGPSPAGALPAGAAPPGVLGMIGDVWEWTQSEFSAYPGFAPYPYREYSEPFFGAGYRVLRGGSWATSARVATATFRNWDFPQRRQIFSGFRVAA
ncbi:MAG TPA: ergothioneine biosynthesis protein EgtB [Solirubrobacteraceae bacterium]|nr:ergothioneine biosynthesis protein EgtB [Solirubrobacteraceae bacterium]